MTFNAEINSEIRWVSPPGVWSGGDARIGITQCSALMGNITLQPKIVNGIFHTKTIFLGKGSNVLYFYFFLRFLVRSRAVFRLSSIVV
jgi:hypothetical protein